MERSSPTDLIRCEPAPGAASDDLNGRVGDTGGCRRAGFAVTAALLAGLASWVALAAQPAPAAAVAQVAPAAQPVPLVPVVTAGPPAPIAGAAQVARAASPARVAPPGEVLVAVAANFSVPMARLAERFAAATGHRVKTSVGSTGRLYSQIVAGAPFDLLLAADAERPARLVSEGRARAEHRFTYALGQLVLWSPQPGRVDADGAVLAGDGFRRLALANPKLAPYGAAAMAVLESRGLAQALAPRLVMGDSIAQAWQFVATGNAELGFVALSQVALPGQPVAGSMWRVPRAMYPPIRQDVVLLTAAEANPAARALLDFLRGTEAREIIAGFGYALDP